MRFSNDIMISELASLISVADSEDYALIFSMIIASSCKIQDTERDSRTCIGCPLRGGVCHTLNEYVKHYTARVLQ